MEEQRFFRIAKALADPQRFRIFQVIAAAEGEVACKALLGQFDVTAATMSHHLKELSNVELIEGRKEGQCVHLSARRAVVEDYLKELRDRVTAQP
jgi:ArsR family transcriptional regulator, arsenate/arsenite/antimonite-responsive transcriptional repressor